MFSSPITFLVSRLILCCLCRVSGPSESSFVTFTPRLQLWTVSKYNYLFVEVRSSSLLAQLFLVFLFFNFTSSEELGNAANSSDSSWVGLGRALHKEGHEALGT